jgi:hypothetical protein
MGVTLHTLRLIVGTEHCVRARRDDHGSARTSRRDRRIDVITVIGTIGREGRKRDAASMEQSLDLPAIVSVVPGQLGRDDLACIGIRGDMQLAPQPARPAAMPLDQPFPRPAQPQAGAVDQQVHRPPAAPPPWQRHRPPPPAHGAMVRHGEFQAKQMQDGADQALGLPQRQAEHRTQRQRRGNR